jgi:hypothetical protein
VLSLFHKWCWILHTSVQWILTPLM